MKLQFAPAGELPTSGNWR